MFQPHVEPDVAAAVCHAALTHPRLKGEHTHQRSGDQVETVQWAPPVPVLFIRVDHRDAEQQQHLQGGLGGRGVSKEVHSFHLVHEPDPFRH